MRVLSDEPVAVPRCSLLQSRFNATAPGRRVRHPAARGWEGRKAGEEMSGARKLAATLCCPRSAQPPRGVGVVHWPTKRAALINQSGLSALWGVWGVWGYGGYGGMGVWGVWGYGGMGGMGVWGYGGMGVWGYGGYGG